MYSTIDSKSIDERSFLKTFCPRLAAPPKLQFVLSAHIASILSFKTNLRRSQIYVVKMSDVSPGKLSTSSIFTCTPFSGIKNEQVLDIFLCCYDLKNYKILTPNLCFQNSF